MDAEVTLRIWNNGTQNHSFRLDPPYDRFIEGIPPGGYRYMNLTSDRPTAGIHGYCADADHSDRGMSVLVTVEQVQGGEAVISSGIAFPHVGGLFASALLVLGLTVFMAVRTPKDGEGAKDGGVGGPDGKADGPRRKGEDEGNDGGKDGGNAA
jgi:hypothetical protein